MAPRESSKPSNRHRSRQSESARREREHQRKKRSQPRKAVTESSEEGPESARRAPQLSSGALAQLNQQNAHSSRRGDNPRVEKIKPERTKRVRREDYVEVERSPAKSPKHGKKSGGKKRVVSGAIMEEGRVRSGIRGGHYSMDSIEKEKDDYYHRQRKKGKNNKKWCKY